MTKLLSTILTNIIKPFYGSGIGKYPPFYQINQLYKKISKNNINIYKTKYGFKMELDLSKLIDKEIILTGVWEKNISELIIKNLKKGDTFLDIGANIGYNTLLGSMIVGNNGKIISFEPSSINFEKLEKNIFLNNFSNIQKYKLGVSDKDAEFDIFYNNDNPGASSLVKMKENLNFTSEKIKTVTLDDFLANVEINMIKMDIEGFEFNAINGMEKILQKSDLKIIFEYSPRIYKEKESNYKQYSVDLLEKLKTFGFKLYNINLDGTLDQINNINAFYEIVLNKNTGQADIFCSK